MVWWPGLERTTNRSLMPGRFHLGKEAAQDPGDLNSEPHQTPKTPGSPGVLGQSCGIAQPPGASASLCFGRARLRPPPSGFSADQASERGGATSADVKGHRRCGCTCHKTQKEGTMGPFARCPFHKPSVCLCSAPTTFKNRCKNGPRELSTNRLSQEKDEKHSDRDL